MHDELHAACFANSVFFVTVLSEMTPFPITTLEPMLVEETHVSVSGFSCQHA